MLPVRELFTYLWCLWFFIFYLLQFLLWQQQEDKLQRTHGGNSRDRTIDSRGLLQQNILSIIYCSTIIFRNYEI